MESTVRFFQTAICKLLFPYAVELARRGRYQEAEDSLSFMLSHDASPGYYLLLGKIYAQQRRYREAIEEWTRVLQVDLTNQPATDAISRAKRSLEGFIYLGLPGLKIIPVMLGFLLVFSVGVNFNLWKKRADIIAQNEEFLQTNQVLSSQYKEIAESYGKLERDLAKRLEIVLKSGYKFAEISVVGALDITLEIQDENVTVYGEIPTDYLKDKVGQVIREFTGHGLVNITRLKVTHHYIVSSGETLSQIAMRAYGDHTRWGDIHRLNQGKIKDPDIIYSGDSLSLP